LIEQSIILLQIIFIDIILAADNAIIIGLIAANFVPKHRKQIILWGVAGALVFKVIFAVFATYLFKFYFIKILGGLLLVWIVNDLRKDLFEIKKIKSPTNAIREIEIPYRIPKNNGFSQFIKNAKNIASKIEQDIPPINPSIVLLGDIGDRDVLPNDFPMK